MIASSHYKSLLKLGLPIVIGQAEDINHEVEKYRAVTAQRIKEVAQRTFVRENCSVLYYKAKKS